MTAPTFEEWLDQGIKLGHCSPVICNTHDGNGLTEEQEAEFDDGGDPCVFVIQVFETDEDRVFLFENFPPFKYRLSEEQRNHVKHS
jgi:hypothetical protein